jgi:hypothetical protein
MVCGSEREEKEIRPGRQEERVEKPLAGMEK